jgi:hypothetical protein
MSFDHLIRCPACRHQPKRDLNSTTAFSERCDLGILVITRARKGV